MRRTAAGSALVCAGFALGAVGATLAGPQVHRTALEFLHSGDAPHAVVAARSRSVPAAPLANRRAPAAVRGASRAGAAAVGSPVPTTAADPRPATQPGPASAQGFGLSVGPALAVTTGYDVAKKSCTDTAGISGLNACLDPARSIDTAAVSVFRILTGLPVPTPVQH